RSIDAQIEHGGTNDAPGTYYSSVVFWYSDGEAQPRFKFPEAAALVPPRRFAAAPNNAAVADLTGSGLSTHRWEEISETLMGGRILEGGEGSMVKVPVTVKAADRYRLTLHAVRWDRYGKVQVSVDGTAVGEPVSLAGGSGIPEAAEI